MSLTNLSKTDYLSYLACPEEFWMSYHQNDSLPAFSLDAQHKVEQGNLIDRLAQDWFKESCIIDDEAIDPDQVAFQYRVVAGNYIAKADITVFSAPKVCDLYEVKAATSLKQEHLHDIAFQRMVFESAGYQVNRTFLIYVNSKYAIQDPIDLCEFFGVENVTTKVADLMEQTRTSAVTAWNWLRQKSLPALTEITSLCGNKLNCSYLQQYYEAIPEYSIFDISRIGAKKLNLLLEMDILDILDVPADFTLSDKQRTQVNVAQRKESIIQTAEIKKVLDGFTYPLYFLDYETFSYVMPCHEGLFPYQQMVFQYSLHVIESEGSEVQHFEYLMPSKETPLDEIFAQMVQQIHPTEGTVLVWNEGFEKNQNKLMAARLPAYADFLHSVNDRVYDLMKIFTQGFYVHPEFKGRTSIKKVLPVLCPELNYGDLEIQNGGAAVIKWHHMTDGRMSETEASQTFQDLLKYCCLDTWAMVRIWEELRNV